MTKHTQGPWTHDGAANIHLADSSGGILGDVPLFSLDFHSPLFESRPEQCKANAALIAAAPDLLEALKEALKFLPEGQNGPWPVKAAAIAAIAKAEGGV